jgi:hypothetical protein
MGCAPGVRPPAERGRVHRLKLTVHDRDGTRTRTEHSLRIG